MPVHKIFRHLLTPVCIILLVTINTAWSQTKKVNNTTQLWSEVDLLGNIGKKFRWQCDIQYSRQSPYESCFFIQYNEQLTIRPWIHYYVNPNFRISSFFGLWYNFLIEDNVGQREYPEYRFALQVQRYWTFGKNKRNILSGRMRVEVREIKDTANVFENAIRGRFMIKYQRLLNKNVYEKGSLYLIAQNELFLNHGSLVTGFKAFDQNRVFIGIGYNLTRNISIETGYFNQFVQHAHNTNFDNNNNWQVSLILSDLTKGKR